MSDLEKWILGLAAVAFAALGGAFWKHVASDADHREKIAEELGRLKQKGEQHDRQLDDQDEEIHDIRRRWHDFRDSTMRDAWKLFEEWKNELIERFGKNRD